MADKTLPFPRRAKATSAASTKPDNGASAPEPKQPEKAPDAYSVHGWASDVMPSTTTPPVVVNSAAKPDEVIAWACGNLEQLGRLLSIIACRGEDPLEWDVGEIAGAVGHFVEMSTAALRGAEEMSYREGRARG